MPLGYTDGEARGLDESIILGSALGEVLGSTLGATDVTGLGSSRVYFDCLNDGKHVSVLLGDSFG